VKILPKVIVRSSWYDRKLGVSWGQFCTLTAP